MSIEDLLLNESNQQYQQYRHLDNLRERYIAFYIALVTAVILFLINTNDVKGELVSLILFAIGLLVLHIAISMRIAQRLTADHLMRIKNDIMDIIGLDNLEEEKLKKCESFFLSTYKPHDYDLYKHDKEKRDSCFQCGWVWKESAIQLIWLLMFLNSIIASYSILIKPEWANVSIVLFFILIIIPIVYSYCEFKKLKCFNICSITILFIGLLIGLFIVSLISSFIEQSSCLLSESLIGYKLKDILILLLAIIIFLIFFSGQFLLFYWRFKSEFNYEKQEDRKSESRKYHNKPASEGGQNEQ